MPRRSRRRTTANVLDDLNRQLDRAGLPPEELAIELNEPVSLVRHWLDGDTPIPFPVARAIAEHAEIDRVEFLEALARDYLPVTIRTYVEVVAEEVVRREVLEEFMYPMGDES